MWKKRREIWCKKLTNIQPRRNQSSNQEKPNHNRCSVPFMSLFTTINSRLFSLFALGRCSPTTEEACLNSPQKLSYALIKLYNHKGYRFDVFQEILFGLECVWIRPLQDDFHVPILGKQNWRGTFSVQRKWGHSCLCTSYQSARSVQRLVAVITGDLPSQGSEVSASHLLPLPTHRLSVWHRPLPCPRSQPRPDEKVHGGRDSQVLPEERTVNHIVHPLRNGPSRPWHRSIHTTWTVGGEHKCDSEWLRRWSHPLFPRCRDKHVGQGRRA